MQLSSRIRALGLLLSSCWLCACASHSHTTAQSAFPGDSLYQLLVGEFAIARGERELALEHYLEQATQTKDAQIAKWAARLAYSLGHNSTAYRATRSWILAAEASGQATPEAHLLMAFLLLERGEAQEGQQQLEAALALGARPDLTQLARQLRIGSARRRRAVKRALSQLSLPDNPARLESSRLHSIALILEADGQLEAALTQLEQARLAFPDSIVQWALNTSWLRDEFRLLTRLGRDQEILRRQRQWVSAVPALPRLRWRLVEELLRQHQPQAAWKELHNWLQESPQEPSLLWQSALLSMALGHFDKAAQRLRQLLNIAGHQAAAQHYLGWLAAQAGDTARATEWQRKAVDASQPMPGLLRLSPLLEHTETIAEYRALLRQLRTTQPQLSPQLWLLEAQLLQRKHRWGESAAVLESALAQFPQHESLAYLRALAGVEGKDAEDGIQRLRALLTHSPQDAALQNALGYSLADQGIELDEARILVQRALKQQPEDAAIIDSMGWVLYRLGQLDTALLYLQRALRLRPSDPEISAHLGELLWALKRHEEARELWARTLAMHPDSPVLRRTMQRFLNT